MNQSWYTLFLLQLTTVNGGVRPKCTTTSTPYHHHTALTILYLTDTPFTKSTEETLARFLRMVSNGTNADDNVRLQSMVLPKKFRSMYHTLRALNDCLSRDETPVVIILDVDEDKVKEISFICSCFHGLLFDIRTRSREVDQDRVFPNTFIVKPSLTRLHEAVERIFDEIGWTTMGEIECYSQGGSNIENIKQQLDAIKESKFPFIFVKCLENLDVILKYGKAIGLTSSEYRWLFPGIFSLRGVREYLPRNVIGVDLPRTLTRYDFTAEEEEASVFLNDVLCVLEKIVIRNSQKLCDDCSSKRFTTFLRRYIVERRFPGYSGDVIFDVAGERRGEIYEIFELIAFDGKHRWFSIGSLEKGSINILFNHWRFQNNQTSTTKKPVLRVVSKHSPPWVTYTSEQQPSTLGGTCSIGRLCREYTNVTPSNGSAEKLYRDRCCTGLLIELLGRLEIDGGFSGVVQLVKDGKYGSNDGTLQWNGMIGEVLRNEADIAVSTLTITAKRSKVVDFTYPFIVAANGILVSTQPNLHSIWEFAFLNTFSIQLWLAMFAAVQVVIAVLWLAERLRQRRRFINDPFKRDNTMTYSDIINYTWSLLFQKASEEVGPSTLGGRTIAALFAFCTIIACSSFTANLAAIKVSERSGISITGIHDSKFQNGNSDFTFGTISDSSIVDLFRDSSDEGLRRIYRKLNVVSKGRDGVAKVAKGEWTVYIDDIPILKYMISKQTNCKLKIAGKPFFASGYGIALQKNSTWNTRLSLVITKLVREGFIQKLESKWLSSTCGDSVNLSTEKLGLNDIGGAFLMVVFGCVVSSLVLGIEYAVWRAMACRARPINAETKKSDVNQMLNSLTKVFTLWDIKSSTKSAAAAEATLRSFRTLTQQRHLGDCVSENSNSKDIT